MEGAVQIFHTISGKKKISPHSVLDGKRVGKKTRIDILGVAVSAINMGDAIAAIEQWIEQRTPHYVCISGVHGVIASRKDPRLCDIHNQAGLVTPDGMPLVWLSHWLGATRIERVYGPDLMRTISARSPARGYRHFYFGGAPGVADRLATALVAANPGTQRGWHVMPAIPPSDAGRGCRSGCANQRGGPRHCLGRPGTPKAGILDGQPYRPYQCVGLDWRRGGV